VHALRDCTLLRGITKQLKIHSPVFSHQVAGEVKIWHKINAVLKRAINETKCNICYCTKPYKQLTKLEHNVQGQTLIHTHSKDFVIIYSGTTR
jgi:hypothetical protein